MVRGAAVGLIVSLPTTILLLLAGVIEAETDSYARGVTDASVVICLLAFIASFVGLVTGAMWAQYWPAPSAIGSRQVVVMAASAVIAGAFMFGLLHAVTSPWVGDTIVSRFFGGLGFGVMGLIFGGIPAMIIAVPTVMAWRALMGRVDGLS